MTVHDDSRATQRPADSHAETTDDSSLPLWNDPSQPASRRVSALIAEMTLEEKIAQLYGVWVGASNDGGEVAPHQHDMDDHIDLDALLPHGLGQLTRPFGSAPVDAAVGARSLQRTQERIVRSNRFGIPAVAHEECLAGFAAWGATAYPVPLSWGATFDPQLIERMAGHIGRDLRSVGVHQGLAPVLDVVRDARWGRVEETIGEDPYLVGTVASAYVRGLERAGIVATLKHFVGYSASKAGRNLAPVSVGSRELADVLLPPFEMAVREAGVRSVMHAYTDIDGVPSAADASLLTGLLRDTWGFDGTVVADYFGIAFLRLLHGVAETWADAAGAALAAGVDVELPTVKAFGAPLVEAVRSGVVDEALVDRALERVLRQKVELGLLDADWSAVPSALRTSDDSPRDGAGVGVGVGEASVVTASAGTPTADALPETGTREAGTVDLDPPANRALAREIAEQAIILLKNDGILPLVSPRRIAVLGPNANEPLAVLGCYSFPAHVGVQHPELPVGIVLPTLVDALGAEFPDAELVVVRGTGVDDVDRSEFERAAEAARSADVVLLALGDRAGLFGRGTSGEGCDAESLRLPGAQQDLVDLALASGTPVVVTLLAGRPYALGAAVDEAAAIVQTFFPGEEGTGALAGVLSGRVNPSGRLPVSVPRSPGAQPSTYLAATLAGPTEVSNIDPTAAYPFGHGLSYGAFEWSNVEVAKTFVPTDGTIRLSVEVRNASEQSGADVVQVYLHDPVADVVRPVQRLIAFARVELDAGATARIHIDLPADLTSFTARDGRRIVDPGDLVIGLGRSSGDIPLTVPVRLTGERRVVDHTRALHADVRIDTEPDLAPSPSPSRTITPASAPASASAPTPAPAPHAG
ncbi:glycoside hydrolase family 3 N-terminal domain-containing protein [Leifsonia sp. ALI-44-B]|uniref:beta-xylosidase/alpha-l-arabinosidase n=1 Tax=Leifsonia sp. ALI-44-B TaxID=1933776 RepID=UPI0009F94A34|nr:glycoside hydrolase family 3 N-terminal domain-containing protein [Leifsonia sp. ALI-44-B]